MIELPLDKAKEVVLNLMPSGLPGRAESLFRFTLLMKEAEVLSLNDIDRIARSGNDLVHLSGLHKIKYSPNKADEIRSFWGRWWDYLGMFPHVREYIITVCEAGYRAGHKRNPWGLFNPFINTTDPKRMGQKPWRTPEWLAEHRELGRRVPLTPLTEFYPYIAERPTEEHDFLVAVDSLVPKSLPNYTRADICQDMIVAILSGAVTLDNLRDATPKYLKQFMKGSPSKYGHLSLDAPVGYGDERTLGQKLGL